MGSNTLSNFSLHSAYQQSCPSASVPCHGINIIFKDMIKRSKQLSPNRRGEMYGRASEQLLSFIKNNF